MDNLNILNSENIIFDEENYELIKLAKDDLEAAKLLWEAKIYPLCIYHLQQTIEKTCKYIGFAFKIIDKKDLKNLIGHNPDKVFEIIFSNEFFKPFFDYQDIIKHYKSFNSDKDKINNILTDLDKYLKPIYDLDDYEKSLNIFLEQQKNSPFGDFGWDDIAIYKAKNLPEAKKGYGNIVFNK